LFVITPLLFSLLLNFELCAFICAAQCHRAMAVAPAARFVCEASPDDIIPSPLLVAVWFPINFLLLPFVYRLVMMCKLKRCVQILSSAFCPWQQIGSNCCWTENLLAPRKNRNYLTWTQRSFLQLPWLQIDTRRVLQLPWILQYDWWPSLKDWSDAWRRIWAACRLGINSLRIETTCPSTATGRWSPPAFLPPTHPLVWCRDPARGIWDAQWIWGHRWERRQ
jgi:hypothetical protein